MVSGSLALLLFIGLDLPLGRRAAALIGDEVHPSVPPGWLVEPCCNRAASDRNLPITEVP